jgi:hypothetical protein
MHFDVRKHARVMTSCVLATIFAVPPGLLAQVHVVSPSDLQKEVAAATQVRRKNIEKVNQFFSSQAAEKALKSAHIDAQQVKTAVSNLSDSELAEVASRADKIQHNLAAGTLSDRDLILVILAIAVLVLIIVAVR